MAVVADVLPLGSELERSYVVHVRHRLKFRVGQIVYVAFSLDETVMGFAFPKDERDGLVNGDPTRFHLPSATDMRFNWVHSTLAELDPTTLLLAHGTPVRTDVRAKLREVARA